MFLHEATFCFILCIFIHRYHGLHVGRDACSAVHPCAFSLFSKGSCWWHFLCGKKETELYKIKNINKLVSHGMSWVTGVLTLRAKKKKKKSLKLPKNDEGRKTPTASCTRATEGVRKGAAKRVPSEEKAHLSEFKRMHIPTWRSRLPFLSVMPSQKKVCKAQRYKYVGEADIAT